MVEKEIINTADLDDWMQTKKNPSQWKRKHGLKNIQIACF